MPPGLEPGLGGRGVLVTGGAGGIGSVLVERLQAVGADPWIHYRTGGDRARTLGRRLGLDGSRLLKADLRSEEEVGKLFDGAEGVTGLVVNAGVWEREHVPLRDMSFEQWRNTLATNLDSAFLCCRELLRRVDGSGAAPSIVLVGSTAGVFGEEGHTDYASSKAAMHGLMLSLKNEIVRIHPRGRVNLVHPGWVVTPMAEKALEDRDAVDRITSTWALRKVGTPEDVVGAVLFLLSDSLAGHVTGQAITVAGGMEGRLLHG